MDDAKPPSRPRTVEAIFSDFKGRRAGLIAALTTEIDEFTRQCDPDDDNLCLFGHPNGSWEVNLPVEEVPSQLPEPTIGINFARDGMDHHSWVLAIAAHSDAWLLSVAFYYAGNFDKNKRKKLFRLISNLPTLYEIVKENRNKSESALTNQVLKPPRQLSPPSRIDDDDDDYDYAFYGYEIDESCGCCICGKDYGLRREDDGSEHEHENACCGMYGKNYGSDESGICCETCGHGIHGRFVNATFKAKLIKQYVCPSTCVTLLLSWWNYWLDGKCGWLGDKTDYQSLSCACGSN